MIEKLFLLKMYSLAEFRVFILVYYLKIIIDWIAIAITSTHTIVMIGRKNGCFSKM